MSFTRSVVPLERTSEARSAKNPAWIAALLAGQTSREERKGEKEKSGGVKLQGHGGRVKLELGRTNIPR